MKIQLLNGTVWDGEAFRRADAETQDGRITRVAAHIAPDGDFVFDATGMILSRGLIDVHTHLRGLSEPQWGAPPELVCMPFGVTTAIEATGDQNDRAWMTAQYPDLYTFVRVDIRQNTPDFSRADARIPLYGDRCLGVKVFFDEGMSEIADISPLRTVCDYAHARGLHVMVHCNHSPLPMAEVAGALGAGDILTHAYHGGKNTAAEDGFASLRTAQARGVRIDMAPAASYHVDPAVLRAGIAAGAAPDLIGSDSTRLSMFFRGGRYGLPMAMQTARDCGMTEEAVFRAVTTTAASLIGQTRRLAVGEPADLAVFVPNGDTYSLWGKAPGYRCKLTVRAGEIAFRD